MLLDGGRLEPGTTILLKRLYSRLELCFLQAEVIDGSDSRNGHAGKNFTAAVHERATHGAKRVFHPVAGGYGIALLKAGELVFAYGI